MRNKLRKIFVIFLIFIIPGSCGDNEKNILPKIIDSKVKEDSLTHNNDISKFNEFPQDSIINFVEGDIGPDFSLQSLSGSKVFLSSFKDQFIILDFWGSWCVPCLRDFPKMKEYYKKYNDQIEIVGIAYLDIESNWRQSVKKNQLQWVNLINDKNSDQDVTVLYGVESFPTKFILNKDRKIIGRYNGVTEEFYKKLDELLQDQN